MCSFVNCNRCLIFSGSLSRLLVSVLACCTVSWTLNLRGKTSGQDVRISQMHMQVRPSFLPNRAVAGPGALPAIHPRHINVQSPKGSISQSSCHLAFFPVYIVRLWHCNFYFSGYNWVNAWRPSSMLIIRSSGLFSSSLLTGIWSLKISSVYLEPFTLSGYSLGNTSRSSWPKLLLTPTVSQSSCAALVFSFRSRHSHVSSPSLSWVSVCFKLYFVLKELASYVVFGNSDSRTKTKEHPSTL